MWTATMAGAVLLPVVVNAASHELAALDTHNVGVLAACRAGARSYNAARTRLQTLVDGGSGQLCAAVPNHTGVRQTNVLAAHDWHIAPERLLKSPAPLA